MASASATKQHTPGPWAIFKGYIVTANPDGSIPLNARIVAPLERDIDSVGEEDARLIAAAPELLGVVRTIAHWQPTVEPEQATFLALDRVIYAARHALAKVEGQ